MGHLVVSFREVSILFRAMGWSPVCSLRRSLVLMYARTTLFAFLPCLFRKELQFGRVPFHQQPGSCSWQASWGTLVGFCYVLLVGNFSRLRHLGWSQCSHGLTSRSLECCHHQCLKAVCGLLEYPAGGAAELLDGSLKLRYCTTPFSSRSPPPSPPWSIHGVVRVVPGGASGKQVWACHG